MAALIIATHRDSSSTAEFDQVYDLLDVLRSHATEVGRVQINNVELSIDHLTSIQEVLGTHHRNLHLNALDLSQDGLSSQSASALAQIISFQKETLGTINLSQNPLGPTAITQILSPLLQDDSVSLRLHTLNLTNTNLGNKGGAALAGFLRYNHTLQSLDLCNNNLGRGVQKLAPAVADNDTLRYLNLSRNNLKSKGATWLVQAFQKSDIWQLKTLDVSDNYIGVAGIQAFGEFLVLDKKLEGFYVGANGIGPQGAAYLANVLKHNYTIKDLRAANNEMGENGSMLLAEELKSNDTSNLERLDLSFNEMGEDVAITLAEALSRNAHLKSLNLRGTQIGSIGATALSDALSYNHTLMELNLSNNQITDEGAFALTTSLAKPGCSIQIVDWSENNFTAEGNSALSRIPELKWNYENWMGDLLQKMSKGMSCSMDLLSRKIADEEILLLVKHLVDYLPPITSFAFNGPLITCRSLVYLGSSALSSPSNIQRLYIKRTSFDEDLLSVWSSSLEQNTILEVLSLIECKITTEGARILARGLSKNSTLRRLNLDRNRFGDEGAQAIIGILPHQTLDSLSLAYNRLSNTVMTFENLIKLKELNLCGNDITDKGALSLCMSLVDGKSNLMHLNLRYNCHFTERGANALKGFLPEGVTLGTDTLF
jgi:Ran GTPase-activating protein (RanGAP) involved in mRNA processing and transport